MSASPRSAVWAHFDKLTRDKARCKECGAILSCSGSSTSGMIRHMRMKHVVFTNTSSSSSVAASPFLPKEEEALVKKRPVLTRPLAEILARLVALDGVSPAAIPRSGFIRESLRRDCFQPPSSFALVMRMLTDFAEGKRALVRSELARRLASGQRFSVAIELCSRSSSRRFLKVSVCGPEAFVACLGLVRLQDDSEEGNLQALRGHLESFGVVFDRHCIACVTDGLVELGSCSIEVVASYSHALQLAVYDLLFETADAGEEMEATEQELEEEEDRSYLEESTEADVAPLKATIERLVNQVRQDIRQVLQNTDLCQVLQKYVWEQHNRVLRLVLDRRARWDSLQVMLSRYTELRPTLLRALHDLGLPSFVPDEDFRAVRQLAEALEPVRMTCASLARPFATLISAEGALRFLCSRLTHLDTPVSRQLLAGVHTRVLTSRHAGLVSLLQFLHNPDLHVGDSFLPRAARPTVLQLAASLLNRLKSCSTRSRPVIPAGATMEQQLQHFIAESEAPPLPLVTDRALAAECDLFELQKRRSENLELLYGTLLCVRPCPGEAGLARYVLKMWPRLSDASVANLAFLNSYLKL